MENIAKIEKEIADVSDMIRNLTATLASFSQLSSDDDDVFENYGEDDDNSPLQYEMQRLLQKIDNATLKKGHLEAQLAKLRQ